METKEKNRELAAERRRLREGVSGDRHDIYYLNFLFILGQLLRYYLQFCIHT